jgi:hypothetical protein
MLPSMTSARFLLSPAAVVDAGLRHGFHRRYDTAPSVDHRQSDVASAKSENPHIMKIAQNIVSAQKREIEQMRR